MSKYPPFTMAENRNDSSMTAPNNEEPKRTTRTIDNALLFLQQHQQDETHPPLSINHLRHKIDLYIIPFLTLCYALNFLDKVLLNYSQVMNLSPSLELRGNNFSNAASAFFIADLIAVIPNIYLLQRLPVAKYLGFSLAAWGICTACHAGLQNYGGLLTVRILSGAFESMVPSALMLLSSQWYTRQEQASRFAYWYSGMGIGQILGGLVSFAFQHVGSGAELEGWRIMFLVLGLVTVVVGAVVWFAVPDTPMNAWFLTDEEKVVLLEYVKGNQTGIENVHFQPKQLVEGLLDFQVWVVFFIVLLQSVGGGVITTYSAMLIRSFGFTAKEAALLNMPAGVINIASALSCGLGSRYFGHRWAWTVSITLVAVVGACLIAFLGQSERAGLLVGIYMVNAITGVQPVDFQWIMCNTAGHTKRAFVSAFMNAAFAIGNIIGPQTFKAGDAPLYRPAKVALVCCWIVSAALAVTLAAYYLMTNRSKDRKAGIEDDMLASRKGFDGLTDKQNGNFRYQY